MPELPEVETIARGLCSEVCGRRITGVDVRYAGSVKETAKSFAAKVLGRRIAGARRRAKLLILDFAPEAGRDGLHLVCHLKMTGRLYVPQEEFAPDKHTHVLFSLDDGRTLVWHDVRKFGWCRAMTPADLADLDFYKSLGPEPLEIGPVEFAARFAGRSAGIKALLLNQTVIAGVGNIYADEALFCAGLQPTAKADRLSSAGLEKLYTCLRDVLTRAIAANGSTISDYRNAQGDAGAFQSQFQVYGRKGEPCPRCGTRLKSATVAGRTSTYCPKCQKKT